MPKIYLHRSIQIEASAEEVYAKINDFNHWSAWSPWLIMEPGARVDVSSDTKYYEWEGNITGSGNMQITHETPNKTVEIDLTFLKPWKSKAKVWFELTKLADSTNVTWFMDSSLPFFLFWMKKMMVAFVGMDFQRGLLLLKDYVEDGEVHSKLDFKGVQAYAGCTYVGIKTECSIKSLSQQMKTDFTRLGEFIGANEELANGKILSIYHKWDMVKDKVIYTAAIPVKEIPSGLPTGIVSGGIPATDVYTLRHTGPYAHLGNAWSTMNALQRSKEFKVNKKLDPFEIYENTPADVPDNQLITDVCFPIKE